MQPAVFYDFFKEYILVIIFNYEIKCEHNHFNSGVNGILLIFIGINLLTNSLFSFSILLANISHIELTHLTASYNETNSHGENSYHCINST